MPSEPTFSPCCCPVSHNVCSRQPGSHNYPVKEQPGRQPRPRKRRILLRLLDQIINNPNLRGENLADGLALQLAGVDTELRRDKTLYPRRYSSVNSRLLACYCKRGNDRDNGILAVKCRLQRVERRVIHLLDGQSFGEFERRVYRSLSRDARHVKPSRDELPDDGRPEISRSLFRAKISPRSM